jgi:hypothetical protein
LDLLLQLKSIGGGEFGGGGGRWCSDIGDEVGEGGIGLVADGRDDGDGAAENGADDRIFVEGPEVFGSAATTGDDEEVGPRCGAVERDDVADRGGDGCGSGIALDKGGADDDVGARPAATEDGTDIMERWR